MANAKPTLLSKRQNTSGPGNTITRKRCPDCDGKWTIEEEGEQCPYCTVEKPETEVEKPKTTKKKKDE